MAEPVRIKPEERLFALTLALMDTTIGLTKAEILGQVRGYVEELRAGVEEASLERKFERDKASLRELGIPLETIEDPSDPGNNQGMRYRIPRAEYRLPKDLRLSRKELALLHAAARVWQDGSLAQAARRGQVKLHALGDVAEDSLTGIAPKLPLRSRAFEALTQAIMEQKVVRFRYLKPGQDAPLEREVLPLAQVLHDERWHLVAEDLQRDNQRRTFLLSRIMGPVTITNRVIPNDRPGVHDEALQELADLHQSQTATLQVEAGSDAGLRLRRRAVAVAGDLITVHYTDALIFADELAGFGPEVLVLSPSNLAELVQERLWLVLAAQGAPVNDLATPGPRRESTAQAADPTEGELA